MYMYMYMYIYIYIYIYIYTSVLLSIYIDMKFSCHAIQKSCSIV